MTVLDRINHALAVQDAVSFGDADWLPGDPLFARPSGWLSGGQTIRPMFQVLRDAVPLAEIRCEPCGVGWEGGEACWMCGVDRPALAYLEWNAGPLPVSYDESWVLDVWQAQFLRTHFAAMLQQPLDAAVFRGTTA